MKYPGWCERCLPMPQQSCEDCQPDGYIEHKDRQEKWPGWCLECGNMDTLSCDDCEWGKFVDGPGLWVSKQNTRTNIDGRWMEIRGRVVLVGEDGGKRGKE